VIPISINNLGIDLGSDKSCRVGTMEEEVEISLKSIHVVHQDCVYSWLMSLRNILHIVNILSNSSMVSFSFLLMLVKALKRNEHLSFPTIYQRKPSGMIAKNLYNYQIMIKTTS
jgi:hypothetical protein